MIFFLHIPKTAGTTFYDIVNANYAQFLKPKVEDESYLTLVDELINSEDVAIRLPGGYFTSQKVLSTIVKLPIKLKQKIEFIGGHVGYGVHQKMGLNVDYISFARNPRERIISDFKEHCKPGRFFYKDLQDNNFKFNEYLKLLKETKMDNLLTRQLAGPYDFFEKKRENVTALLYNDALENLKNIAFFNIKNFEESIFYISKKFNWKKIKYKIQNKSSGKKKEIHIDEELLNEIIKFDLRLYDQIKFTNIPELTFFQKILFKLKSK